MRKPDFERQIDKLVQIKVREIIDGCLYCQGVKKNHDGTLGCNEHQQLIVDMVLNPRKYAKELRTAEPIKSVTPPTEK